MKLFLKPNVAIEPLFQGFYAWAHLINPLTAAMNIAFRHLRIMKKFLENPEMHKNIQNQKFQTGPIARLEAEQLEEVENLLKKTDTEGSELIKLANAIKKANSLVLNEGIGGSLEGIYRKMHSNWHARRKAVWQKRFDFLKLGFKYLQTRFANYENSVNWGKWKCWKESLKYCQKEGLPICLIALHQGILI